MRETVGLAARIAGTEASVLILGESGTGKEVLARAIHQASPRRAARLVKVDCAALPESLLESELFGHERGAFTDAVAEKPGRLELAPGGTLFLDEIGAMGLAVQAKLLRFLQERRFERVGGTTTIAVDVRVIAATNLDLETARRENRFREDLFYRLCVVPIRIPPLRRRPEDILPLAEAILRACGARYHREPPKPTAEAQDLLRRYPWPGNVRELEHVLERAMILAEGETIGVEDLDVDLVAAAATPGPDGSEMTLAELEREYIRRILRKTRHHTGRAAAVLGINRKTLWEKRRRYGLP
jgi:DNA-binding NtrC family response regulator